MKMAAPSTENGASGPFDEKSKIDEKLNKIDLSDLDGGVYSYRGEMTKTNKDYLQLYAEKWDNEIVLKQKLKNKHSSN